MATLAEFRAAYPQYDAVPDVKLADSLHQKFYSQIPKMDFYKTIGLGSAATIPGGENVITGVKPPEVSMRDRISGIIETPLALGATLAGGLISPIAGGISLAASGQGINTPEGRRALEAGMKSVQYQPRTQTRMPREGSGARPETRTSISQSSSRGQSIPTTEVTRRTNDCAADRIAYFESRSVPPSSMRMADAPTPMTVTGR